MKVSIKKKDITPEVRGISMLGFGDPHNIVKGVETPISVRVICLQDQQGYTLFFINFEICFITDSIYSELKSYAKQLSENHASVVHIMAQHTHSAPSGYDHYALYNMPTPGFVPQVLDSYIDNAKDAMREAYESLSEGSIEYCKGEIPTTEDVSFNRSLNAYLMNPEVRELNLPTSKRSAVDKTMRLLKVQSQENEIIGSLNWFAVHATNISGDNFYISPDNKGYAALEVESHYIDTDKQDHIALFSQGCAGDVSPNYLKSPNSRKLRGKYVNPFDSARYNGALQANMCRELLESESEKLKDKIQALTVYRDLSNIAPLKKFLGDNPPTNARTTEPCHGVAFIQGTKDGPGIHESIGFLIKLVAQIVKYVHILISFTKNEEEKNRIWSLYRNQAPKSIFVNAGDKSILGIKNISQLPIPGFIDPLVKILKDFDKKGALKELSWTQKILPVQLIKLGDLFIVGLPGEVTTIAGLRIQKQIKDFFGKDTQIIISPYSNAFCGYIVTHEEYEMQFYEGGHTVFGKWTLAAFQTIIEDLCIAMRDNKEPLTIAPPRFSQKELDLRTNYL